MMARPMTTPAPASPRHCIKCGREIGPDETVCDICNRAGMATPSSSQYHGTVAVAIVLAVAALAVAASLSLRGVGPYAAEVQAVTPADTVGYAITYAVTNEGTKPGRAKCLIVATGPAGERLRSRNTITAPIPGGETTEMTEEIPGLELEPSAVTISCD
jgi:predicted nucleic acid-binding Zn ribbon protein